MPQYPIPYNPLSRPLFIAFSLALFFFPFWGLWRTLAHRDVPPETKSETKTIAPSDPKTNTPSLSVARGGNETIAPVDGNSPPQSATTAYPIHNDIMATMFWVGEDASADNHGISNGPSAWDDEWVTHFGGIDDPTYRIGLLPGNFIPKENPFYIALPYNDFDKNGNRRKGLDQIIDWAGEKHWGLDESMLKNHWVRITRNGKTVYAQWEDVGPFGEDDAAYVWGVAAPNSKTNEHAGIDLSPAVNAFLDGNGLEPVDWQFVDARDVPDGPWKEIITTSQIDWK